MEKTSGVPKAEWTAEATSCLIDLWEEHIDELRGVRKNSHVFKEMADKLGIPGLTAVGVKNKVENLTKKYRKEQTKVGPSGGAPSTWEHYEKINKILATSKAINYKRLMVESIDLTPLTNTDHDQIDAENSADSFCEASTSQGKRRKVDKFERLIEIEERKLEIVSEVAEEMKSFHEKLLDIFAKRQ